MGVHQKSTGLVSTARIRHNAGPYSRGFTPPLTLPVKGRGICWRLRRRRVSTMAELLLELFSEEIPARMQARAAEDLRRLVTEGLKAQGLAAGEAKAFATPRRLTLVVEGVPAKSPDLSRGAQGPARRRARAGDRRVRQVGGAQVDRGSDSRQGREEGRLLRRKSREARAAGGGDRRRGGAGRAGKFPWPKSMRWGSGKTDLGASAAFDRLPARRQGRAVRDRGGGERQRYARPSLPRQRAVRGDRAGRTTSRRSRHTKSSWIRPSARPSSPSRPARWPRSTSWRWSRTRRCSPRTPGSRSGRRC